MTQIDLFTIEIVEYQVVFRTTFHAFEPAGPFLYPSGCCIHPWSKSPNRLSKKMLTARTVRPIERRDCGSKGMLLLYLCNDDLHHGIRLSVKSSFEDMIPTPPCFTNIRWPKPPFRHFSCRPKLYTSPMRQCILFDRVKNRVLLHLENPDKQQNDQHHGNNATTDIHTLSSLFWF
jgi:hypothetical protein